MGSKAIITGVFFAFVYLFGFWLSHSGKPFNSLIFNFHKLVGLAMGIFLILTVYRVHKTTPFSPVEILAITATIVIFMVLVVAGGLLSIQATSNLEITSQSIQTTISVTHKVFPYLAVLTTAGMLYLLLFQKT